MAYEVGPSRTIVDGRQRALGCWGREVPAPNASWTQYFLASVADVLALKHVMLRSLVVCGLDCWLSSMNVVGTQSRLAVRTFTATNGVRGVDWTATTFVGVKVASPGIAASG